MGRSPSADWLFSRAILQSAPFNYGDQSVATGNALGALISNSTSCTTLDCLQKASVTDLLDNEQSVASMATSPSADQYIPGVASGEPFKPIVDGEVVKQNLFYDSTHLVRT